MEYHKKSEKFYATDPGGIKVALPRYYREKIWPKDDLESIGARIRNRAKVEAERNKKIQERDRKFKLSGEDPGLHDRISKEQLQNNFISKIKKGNKL